MPSPSPRRSPLRRSLLALAAVITTAVTALIVWPANAAANAVANPGFESGLSEWSCSGAATSGTDNPRTGSLALVGAPTESDNAACSQDVAVSPNSTYTFSAYVNGSYVFLSATNTGTTDPSNWTPSTSGTYQQLSLTVSTGPSTTEITIHIHGWYGQDTYHADDVALTDPGATDPDSPSVTASASPTDPVTPSPSNETTEPSATASAPQTATPGTGSLPEHSLIGYWQNFTNGAETMRLGDVPSSYDLVVVAFADADGSAAGAVSFDVDSGLSSALGGYTNEDLKEDIATLHARGTKVVLSVGGQNGTISVGDTTASDNFAASVYSLIQDYGFDGVDIDLENGLVPDAMSAALFSLHDKVGSDLIITLAPETLYMQAIDSSYLSLAIKIKDILTVVHTQYYNSGSMLGCDGQVYSQGTVDFITAQACIALQAGLAADQIALGVPASTSAAGSGYVDPSVVNAALDCLTAGTSCGDFQPPQTWPGLRGAMTWSINWDAASGYALSSSVSAHLDSLP